MMLKPTVAAVAVVEVVEVVAVARPPRRGCEGSSSSSIGIENRRGRRGLPGDTRGREKREKRDAEEKDKAWLGGGAFRRVSRGLFGEQRACRLGNDRGTTIRQQRWKEKNGGRRERERKRETYVHECACSRVFLRDLNGRLTRHRK